MSLGFNRDSISTMMNEVLENMPTEAEGRASISDFGKMLFTEGHNRNSMNADSSEKPMSQSTPKTHAPEGKVSPGTKRTYSEIKGVPRQKQHEMDCVVNENGQIAISQSSARRLMKSKGKAVPKRWSPEEDNLLREAVQRHGERNWKSIAEEVPGRNHTQCLQRWTKVLAPGLVKGHWRPDEDNLLKKLVAEGRKNWGQVAMRIPGRTSKQCRERWYNHLDPSIVRGEYSAEEDRIILDAQARLGNRWSAIAAMLPGRTEDAVKIRWKSLCRVRKGSTRRAQTEKSSPYSENGQTSMPSNSQSYGQEMGYTPMGHVPPQNNVQMNNYSGRMPPNNNMNMVSRPDLMFPPNEVSQNVNYPAMQPMGMHQNQMNPMNPIMPGYRQPYSDQYAFAHDAYGLVPQVYTSQPMPYQTYPSNDQYGYQAPYSSSSEPSQEPPPQQSVEPKVDPPASYPSGKVDNPVAKFMQNQHLNQKRKATPPSSHSSGNANPAAAFAQKLSQQATEPKTNPDDGDKSHANEPSLKKVKPRLSIEAARASAARRMRASGSNPQQGPRGSLDVFLNEIGDVGRMSDLKMEEFQDLENLWRVSDDLSRMSL